MKSREDFEWEQRKRENWWPVVIMFLSFVLFCSVMDAIGHPVWP